MENLMAFPDWEVGFTMRIFKKNNSSSGLVIGSSDEIARALAENGGDDVLQREREAEMNKEFEKAARKTLKASQGLSQTQDEAEQQTFKHSDFFRSDRVRPAFDDPNDVMGGETQAVDEFVVKSRKKRRFPDEDITYQKEVSDCEDFSSNDEGAKGDRTDEEKVGPVNREQSGARDRGGEDSDASKTGKGSYELALLRRPRSRS